MFRVLEAKNLPINEDCIIVFKINGELRQVFGMVTSISDKLVVFTRYKCSKSTNVNYDRYETLFYGRRLKFFKPYHKVMVHRIDGINPSYLEYLDETRIK